MKLSLGKMVFAAALSGIVALQASAATITLNPTHDNRLRTDSLTGNSETNPSDLIGNVSATRNHLAVLAFDLSAIPDGETVLSVTLDATFDPDGSGNSVDLNDGTGDMLVQEMLENPDRVNGWNWPSQSFGPDQTGNTGDDVAWVGGSGGTLGAVLSSVADTTFDPEGIAAGTPFNWASSAGFISAIQGNLGDDEILLQVVVPGSMGGSRSFVRSNNDFALTVTYTPEPASLALIGLGGLMIMRRRRA